MDKILVKLSGNYYQYACIIYGREGITRDNISYSIYPHRALSSEHLEAVRNALPEFEFKVAA